MILTFFQDSEHYSSEPGSVWVRFLSPNTNIKKNNIMFAGPGKEISDIFIENSAHETTWR